MITSEIYIRLRNLMCSFREIIDCIPGEGRLLDVGSSYGTFCFALANRKPGVDVTGLELIEKRVHDANERAADLPNLSFIACDIHAYTPPHRFDVVTCLDILHHSTCEDQRRLIQKSRDLLQEDGMLILKDMDTRPRYKYLWNYLHDSFMGLFVLKDSHLTHATVLNFRPKEETARLLENEGFTVETTVDISNALYAHYFIVAKKSVTK